MIKIYANKSALEKDGVCHRNSVDSWLKQGKLEEVIIVGGIKNEAKMYIVNR